MSTPIIGAYYRSQKYNPENGVEQDTYQVIGIGYDVTSSCSTVIYRPLKCAFAQANGILFYTRQLTDWEAQTMTQVTDAHDVADIFSTQDRFWVDLYRNVDGRQPKRWPAIPVPQMLS